MKQSHEAPGMVDGWKVNINAKGSSCGWFSSLEALRHCASMKVTMYNVDICSQGVLLSSIGGIMDLKNRQNCGCDDCGSQDRFTFRARFWMITAGIVHELMPGVCYKQLVSHQSFFVIQSWTTHTSCWGIDKGIEMKAGTDDLDGYVGKIQAL